MAGRVRKDKEQDILHRLRDLQDSQMETALLRSCLSLPKVLFVLHSCPPDHLKDAMSVFDTSMLEALSDLAGGPLPEWSWLRASLPSSLGGLGIRPASFHSSAAYIAALLFTPEHSLLGSSAMSLMFPDTWPPPSRI